MRDNGSLRGRLLGNLALLLVVLMLASGLSAYWNGREAADTGAERFSTIERLATFAA